MKSAVFAFTCVIGCLGGRVGLSQSPGDVRRCEALLVSQQSAAAVPQPSPVFRLEARNGARLVYFGVRHTFDPADTQLVAMQREFAGVKPTAVFFEGTSTRIDTSASDAVRTSGEPGFARFLARGAGVPSLSLEPPRDSEVGALLHQFSAEDLVMFYTLRPLEEARDRNGARRPRLDTLLARQLAALHRTPGLTSALEDTAAFRSEFARKFPGVDPLAVPANWFDPVRSSDSSAKRLFNSINYASSMFRDVYMYRELAAAMLDPDARIFAEVGHSHIPAQAQALRCVAAGAPGGAGDR
jgi:hypothetical protein